LSPTGLKNWDRFKKGKKQLLNVTGSKGGVWGKTSESKGPIALVSEESEKTTVIRHTVEWGND